MTTTTAHRSHDPHSHLPERVSAVSYGTILVLAALATIHASDVESGFGWELVAGVGAATLDRGTCTPRSSANTSGPGPRSTATRS